MISVTVWERKNILEKWAKKAKQLNRKVTGWKTGDALYEEVHNVHRR